MSKQVVPYGLWPSPVSAEAVSQSLRFRELRWDNESDALVWLEERSDRGVLVACSLGDAPRDLTEEHHVRARVGYGGGDFDVAHGHVVYAEKSGRLYMQRLSSGAPWPITPGFGAAAAPVIDSFGRWVLYVHSYEGKDCLATVDVEGRRWPHRLVSGADFYMQPAVHPDGATIAWIEWDHPNMPWDGCRLLVAHVDASATDLSDTTLIAGGQQTPVFQPAFSPDGRYLSYITTESDWDQLVLYDIYEGAWRTLLDLGCSLMEPAWVQGMRTYAWSHDGRSLVFLRNDQGISSLWRCDVESGECFPLEMPYTAISQPVCSARAPKVGYLASSAQIPQRVVVQAWQEQAQTDAEASPYALPETSPFASEEGIETTDFSKGPWILRRATGERLATDFLPTPKPISWSASDGTEVFGLYYAPSSATHQGTGLPPVILDIHGGPTAQRVASYSSDVAFFTSRGFGLLAVNYRGSTGYGKAYRDALRERWGEVDVEDAAGAAKALIEQKLADPERLVIRGGSAGGYTVLNALVHHPGLFRAGVSLFGVSNLFTLAADTHKFEARYLDSLVGPLPEAAERYRTWSPIFHANKIQDPVAIFQGDEDRVVPPDQSASIAQALKSRGVPHIYRLFAGEGHGWRKSETILAYYRELMDFLKEHVLFS
ncbi:MAG: S9 family peptidase [Myxococcales bacterium]|nr:S9 family peptidase [Myxococcales bacterium]